MPFVEDIWVSHSTPRLEKVATAAVGSLIFQLDGKATFVAARPVGADRPPIRIQVDLDNFSARLIGGALDDAKSGAAVDYRIEVDPRSAYDPAERGTREAGDIVTNGAYIGIYAQPPEGEAVAGTLEAAISTAPMLAYRQWRVLVDGRVVYARLDIG